MSIEVDTERVMNKLREGRLLDARTDPSRPIYHEILDIAGQALLRENRKSSEIYCIVGNQSLSSEHDSTNPMKLRYVERPPGYIAVSCPWELPPSEDSKTDGYCIEQHPDGRETIPPQNVVLDRVTRYAKSKGLPFWIDKLLNSLGPDYSFFSD